MELTETGRALRAAGLRILDTVLTSATELIAHPGAYRDPERRRAMEQLHTLLSGVLEARGRVLLKLNVDEAGLTPVLELLPALKAPTVSKLSGGDAYAVESVVAKTEINTLIPALKEQRRDRHHRDPHRQDRALMGDRHGRVVAFDTARGLGSIEADDGHRFGFPLHPTRRHRPKHRGRDHGAVPGPARPPGRLGGRRGAALSLTGRARRRRCRCGSAPG